MKTITFYSYKGGVGRTLALANIAKRLAEFGKKVCMIDFDLEAPGLHHKFKDNIGKNGINQGIVDYINYFNCNNSTPKSLKEYVTPLIFNNKYKNIDFIAAGNVYSDKYWKTLFSIDWVSMFYKKDSQGVALFVDLKERIKNELNPDYLLIDSRTGISEISGITMSLMADEIVLLAARNDENLQGIKQIIKTLSQPENTLTGKIPKLDFVLCRIPYFEKPEEKNIEKRLVNDVVRDVGSFINENKLPIKFENIFIIHSDPRLEINERLILNQNEKEEYNKLLEFTKLSERSPIINDYSKLFEELTKWELSEEKKLIFDNIRKSEDIIEKAKSTSDNTKKINLLLEAIKLNRNSDEAYSLMAISYYTNGDINKALDYINKAIDLNQYSNEYLCTKGFILNEMNDVEEAENIYTKVIKRDSKNFLALFGLGNIFFNKMNFKEALEYYSELKDFYPDYPGVYNNIGNVYRLQKKYEKAFEYIFKALEIDPRHAYSTSTLAEIYAQKGNNNEFYKNFELALSFGLSKKDLEKIFKEEVYKPYFKEQKFLNLLAKYNIDIDISKYE